MTPSEVSRALAAAVVTASAAGLSAEETVVLHNSNKLAVRLLPCDVFARVAPVRHHVAQLEVDLAGRLAGSGSPIVLMDPRVEPRVYEHDGFVVTFWTYHEPLAGIKVSPMDYSSATERLHSVMRNVKMAAPRFTDRVAAAEELVASPDRTPILSDVDRATLIATLRNASRAIEERRAAEQLLHGEPHPGNLLNTKEGLLFIDLETCCRGPVEFDLAHVPKVVTRQYRGVDRVLLGHCRGLVLAMVAAWRWDRDDQFPDGERAGRELLNAVRAGPPWPALDDVMRQPARSAKIPLILRK